MLPFAQRAAHAVKLSSSPDEAGGEDSPAFRPLEGPLQLGLLLLDISDRKPEAQRVVRPPVVENQLSPGKREGAPALPLLDRMSVARFRHSVWLCQSEPGLADCVSC